MSSLIKLNRLKELDISIKSELKVDKNFYLPFNFKISNIFDDNRVDISELAIYHSDYAFDNVLLDIKSALKDIDLDKIEFEDKDLEFLEDYKMAKNQKDNYIFKEFDEFIKFFMRLYGSNPELIAIIGNFINSKRIEIFEKYQKTLNELLLIDSKKEEMSIEYMDLRILETSPDPFFSENKNKTIQDYSLREVLLRRTYFTRKNQLDLMKYEREKKMIEASRNSR